MTPLQQLIAHGLRATDSVPSSMRIKLLKAAITHLPKQAADCCRAEIVCLRNAEAHQLKLIKLLQEVAK